MPGCAGCHSHPHADGRAVAGEGEVTGNLVWRATSWRPVPRRCQASSTSTPSSAGLPLVRTREARAATAPACRVLLRGWWMDRTARFSGKRPGCPAPGRGSGLCGLPGSSRSHIAVMRGRSHLAGGTSQKRSGHPARSRTAGPGLISGKPMLPGAPLPAGSFAVAVRCALSTPQLSRESAGDVWRESDRNAHA